MNVVLLCSLDTVGGGSLPAHQASGLEESNQEWDHAAGEDQSLLRLEGMSDLKQELFRD